MTTVIGVNTADPYSAARGGVAGAVAVELVSFSTGKSGAVNR
jgi:hypothetical protein